MEDDSVLMVEEAMGAYIPKYLDIGQAISLKELLRDKLLTTKVIKGGLPYPIFENIKVLLPYNEEEWAEILGMSAKSLQRYRLAGNHIFKPIHSEKIIQLAEVALQGKALFGSIERFHLWLRTPSTALGGMLPSELLSDAYGKDLVLSELVRIEHGIFA